jgi:hypothetical protein
MSAGVSKKAAHLHTYRKNIRSPSTELHTDGRATYSGEWPCSPRVSVTGEREYIRANWYGSLVQWWATGCHSSAIPFIITVAHWADHPRVWRSRSTMTNGSSQIKVKALYNLVQYLLLGSVVYIIMICLLLAEWLNKHFKDGWDINLHPTGVCT